MEEAKAIAAAITNGTLRLGSNTGATIPVLQLQNHPKISKDWGFETSFDDLCKQCLYCFRILNKSRENNKPHFAIWERDSKIGFVQISNNRFGITVSAIGEMPKSVLSNNNADISKDGRQMVVDYLVETNAADLVV